MKEWAVPRRLLTDEKWEQFKEMMRSKGLYVTKGSRDVMEAILWRHRVGCSWRDVPSLFCPWQTAYNKFNRWSKRGLWENLFLHFRGDVESGWVFIDGTKVRAHQHACGAGTGKDEAIGRSCGGSTTTVGLACDERMRPLWIEIDVGQAHDSRMAPAIIRRVRRMRWLVGDKGYDSEFIRMLVRLLGGVPVIPRRRNSRRKNPEFDPDIYKRRHIVENAFARLKHLHGFATRRDKLARNFRSMAFLSCALIWLDVKL